MRFKEIFSSRLMEESKRVEEARAWVQLYDLSDKSKISSQGVIDVDDTVIIDYLLDTTELPVQFGKINGNFHISNLKQLTSLKGCPHYVNGSFGASSNNLTSLEYAPSEVKGPFYCYDNKIESLNGISKIIKTIDGLFLADFDKIKEGGLELLLIDGLKLPSKLTAPPFLIIRNHLNKLHRGSDIFQCQAELIEAGFEKFATL